MKHSVDMTEIQEQHLDMMIKLAFDLADAENIQQLLSEPDPGLSNEDEFFADQILAKAFLNAEYEKNDIRKNKVRSANRSVLPKVVRIAACLIIALTLTLPLAFAASAEFRAQFLEFLIQFDAERGEARFQFIENPSETISVPENWTGDFFPTYVPNGFELTQILEEFTLIEYQAGDKSSMLYCNSFRFSLTFCEETQTGKQGFWGPRSKCLLGTAVPKPLKTRSLRFAAVSFSLLNMATHGLRYT